MRSAIKIVGGAKGLALYPGVNGGPGSREILYSLELDVVFYRGLFIL